MSDWEPPAQPPPPGPVFVPPAAAPPPPTGYTPLPAQPGYGHPAAIPPEYLARKKKRRKRVIITLLAIVGALALSIGACTVWFISTVTAPVDESNRFLSLIDDGSYDAAVAMTNPRCNAGLTTEALVEIFAGQDIAYDLNNSSVVNRTATVRGTLDIGSQAGRITLTLQKSGDDWRLCGFRLS